MPNRLIHSSSPYLLQHANNPVDWYEWGPEALERAKREDKPILVSIGYSACHWCHVMERESFEKEEVAAVMNEHFVCIKVDREERPDVDGVYMEAVQQMGIQGGWPLNVFLTSAGKPFYGGTYFPKARWVSVLTQIAEGYEKEREKLEQSADAFADSLQVSVVEKYGLTSTETAFSPDLFPTLIARLSRNFDKKMGGLDRAPKFPMPSIWRMLLRLGAETGDQAALDHLILTLNRMEQGGIYDQVGGGFARYSTDGEWHVPHFEKMLYDNGQLVTLYSEAHRLTGKPNYRRVIDETLGFVERELTSEEGAFYSALDADSEGEEGLFYVWSWKELGDLLGEDVELFADYYGVKVGGNWEGHNVLIRWENDSVFCAKHKLDPLAFQAQVKEWKATLLEARSTRVRPGLDDKVLLSWNALMLQGYAEAYRATSEEHYLEVALRNAEFLEAKMVVGDKLHRTYKNGKASLDGYLEDYALLIDAYLSLYQATFDERWVRRADAYAKYAVANFYDKKEGLFFYTDESGPELIARQKELFDNVIPSSNAVMATDLYLLGLLLEKEEYTTIAEGMMAKVAPLLDREPGYLGHWAQLYTMMATPTAEVVIIAKNPGAVARQIDKEFAANTLLMGTRDPEKSKLPLIDGKYLIDGDMTIFVCYNKACRRPSDNVEQALAELRKR